MDNLLPEQIRSHEITRLCHLTPSRNLVHIASGTGILSTSELHADERSNFTPQDLARLDGRPNHISCSIQYPNAYYLRYKSNVAGEATNFRDWVVLGIKAECMLRPDTLFSPSNAAGGSGAHLKEGCEGFLAMYADEVEDSSGRIFPRGDHHLKSCPTNLQAEVMISRLISLSEITTIFAPDPEHAARQYARLEQIGADPNRFEYKVAPDLFEASQLSAKIRTGLAPDEIEWNPPA